MLVGCFIPFNLIASDPVQFASIENVSNPFNLLVYPAVQAMGLFLFWPIYLFFLSPKKLKSLLSLLFAGLALGAFSNFFIFYKNYGIISDMLNFQIADNFYLAGSFSAQLINILVCIVLIMLAAGIVRFRKTKILLAVMTIGIISTGFLCIVKLVGIKGVLTEDTELQQRIARNTASTDGMNINPVFNLSRTGKNVLVIMLDRAINSYFPLILEEKTELKESFNGFTYYPNTASLYRRTIFGTPPLFGGYEYTTYAMNKRNDMLMKDKHNEATLVLPELFKQNGYDVFVTDLPYVNYQDPMDPEFYIQRGIRAQNIVGLYKDKYIHDVLSLEEYPASIKLVPLLQRNILLFSILESSIYSLRDIIYQNGKYWSTEDYSHDAGVPRAVINNFTTLYYLPELTDIRSTGGDTFTVMVNSLTHSETYLQYPDYTVQAKTTETGHNFFGNSSFKYYHTNIAAYIQLAKWFTYLRTEGVWDNTRIVIVSDHGDSGLTHPDFSSFQNNYVLQYNPILLFKDFSENGELKTDMGFMTSADTPLLAVKDIIENAVNPFTGRILAPDKKDGIYLFTEGNSNTGYYNGTTCLEDNSKFYYVHEDIFDSKNWKELVYRDFKNIK
jgi:hypothetical protein